MEPVEKYGLTPEQFAALEAEGAKIVNDDELDWVAIARDAWETSDDYFGSALSKQVQKNIAAFNSKHPSGSKYHSEAYRFRSKTYRPKTRSSIRRHEAASVEAYFASEDIVLCESENEGSREKSAGAHIGERLLNYRLKQPEFMWFQTCVGAYQDAMVQGAVISRQEWKYNEEYIEKGNTTTINVLIDQSGIDLVPLENIRFDPNSDWRDPINNSPYVIEQIPMFTGDVKSHMGSNEKDPSKNWIEYSDEELQQAGEQEGFASKTVRDARNEGREDPKDEVYQTSDFEIVWVHRNIIRVDGVDYIFYTLGTNKLLSQPVPLREVYPHGRPYVIGFANLETHKCVPAAFTEMVSGIQQEANEIANGRLDNVKLVVNRRSFVRRAAKIDTRSMTRSVPGGVVLVDDINADVRYDAPPDVTSSSYAEQDRLNVDFDELAGSFSGSSVNTNRQLGETVGGMEIMTSDSASVSGYQLRIFAETWVKPVLRQILKLEQAYLSDLGLLAQLMPTIPPKQSLQLLQGAIKVKLNVGFGATSPARRVEKLSLALQTLSGFIPHLVTKLDEDEITKEVFGALGYQDGRRFLKQDKQDPRITQLEQQVQELTQLLQGRQLEIQSKERIAQFKEQGGIRKAEIAAEAQIMIAQLQAKLDFIDAQIKAEGNEIKLGQLYLQREAIENNMKIQRYQAAMQARDGMAQRLLTNNYGTAPGIEERPGPG